jgi:hypothetical protein
MAQVEGLVATIDSLKYKHVRVELLMHLVELGDRDRQYDRWLSKPPKGMLDYSIHFLFDDFPFCNSADGMIGIALWNDQEAQAVKKVCQSIEAVADVVGWNAADSEWLASPGWEDVLRAARDARDLLLQNDFKDANREFERSEN